MSWNRPHRPAPIAGCNHATIFDHEHYYDCRPYQHDRYTFTHLDTGEQTTQEAMHALLPVRRILPPELRKEGPSYSLEEAIHALLHGDVLRARILARPLGLTIDHRP